MTRLQCRIVYLGTNKVSECRPYLQTSHTTLPELLYKHQIVRTKKHDADKAVSLEVFHTTANKILKKFLWHWDVSFPQLAAFIHSHILDAILQIGNEQALNYVVYTSIMQR